MPAEQAWQKLPASAWNTDTARHLLRRAGWAARPEEVARAVREGLDATLDRLFPARPPELARPAYLVHATARADELSPLRRAAQTPEERQVIDR